MTNVGFAAVQIIPSMRGFQAAMQRELGQTMPRAGEAAGRQMGQGVESGFSKSVAGLGNIAKRGVQAVGATLLAGGVAAGTWGLKLAAANEQADISFTTMLGSAEAAGAFLEKLRTFAADTPFEFPELQTAASSLISAGIEADKVIPIMTSLGDATSGMGTGAEGVKRATVALQQMNAAGRITGEDLNQLRDAGIPVFDLLAAATGKAKSEVAALAQAGKLGKTELDQLMGALESGVGLEKFSGLMDEQSRSLTGLIATMKDTYGQKLSTAMEPAVDRIKEILPAATEAGDALLDRLAPALAGAIGAGAELLPDVLNGLDRMADGAGNLAEQFRPTRDALRDVFTEAGPLVEELGDNLLPIVKDLAEITSDVLPVALLTTGGGLSIALHAAVQFSDVIEPLTGFLADNEAVVVVLTAAYAGYSASQLVATAANSAFMASMATGYFAAQSAQLRFFATLATLSTSQQIQAISTAITNMATTAVSGAAIAGGALAGIAVGAAAATYALDKWHDAGRANAEAFTDGLTLDTSRFDGGREYLNALSDRSAELLKLQNSKDTGFAEDERLAAQIIELEKVGAAAELNVRGMYKGLGVLKDETGLTTTQVKGLAAAAGTDLYGAFDDTGKLAPEVAAELEKLSGAAELAGVDLKSIEMTPEQVAKLETDAKAVQSAIEATAGAYADFGNILSLKDESLDPKARAAAEEALADAKDRAEEARGAAAAGGQTAEEAERTASAYADAKDNLVDAQSSLNDLLATDSPLNKDKITTFYMGAIEEARTFAADVQTAIEAGYDPALVGKLIAAGPEQAGPVLAQLVSDTTGSYVEMINGAEAELGELSAFAVRTAQLTQQAINAAGTDSAAFMAESLDEANRIAVIMMTARGNETIEQLAGLAGLEIAEFRSVAEAFGIQLDGIKEKLGTIKLDLNGLPNMSIAAAEGSSRDQPFPGKSLRTMPGMPNASGSIVPGSVAPPGDGVAGGRSGNARRGRTTNIGTIVAAGRDSASIGRELAGL